MRRVPTLILLIGLALLAAPILAGGTECQKQATAAAHSGKACEMGAEECAKWMAEAKTRPWLGVELDVDEATGALTVVRVVPRSPAERAGFREGDLLVAMNGVAYGEANHDKLAAIKKSIRPGDTVTYSVNRNGAEQQLAATLAKMPDEVYVAMVEEHEKEHSEIAAR